MVNPNAIDLDVQAAEYLYALLDEHPTSEPEETRDWAEALLEAIRVHRDSQRGTEIQSAARLLGLLTATDKYRFVWELWQNADDSGATDLEFEISEDTLVVRNNGSAFSSVQVQSLLYLATSTKDLDVHTIGQFGIGSLTLMRTSNTPTYRSGHYSFQLTRSYTYPSKVETLSQGYVEGTEIIAPLDNEVDPKELLEQLVERTRSEELLYMKHLKSVTVLVDGNVAAKAEIDIQPRGRGQRVLVNGIPWLRLDATVTPPEGLKRLSGADPGRSISLTLIRRDGEPSAEDHPVVVYFPTKVYHRYPWRFSAPLDVPISREALSESTFNKWLLGQIGETMVAAAIDPDIGMPKRPWDLIPLGPTGEEFLDEVWVSASRRRRRRCSPNSTRCRSLSHGGT